LAVANDQRDRVVRCKKVRLLIAPVWQRLRHPFELPVHEVDEPVFRDASVGIDRGFVTVLLHIVCRDLHGDYTLCGSGMS